MRNLLVFGGLAVVALCVGLWLLLHKGDDASAETGTTQGSQAVVAPPHTSGTPSVTSAPPGEHPALPTVGSGENPRDYVVGDIRVRDHRAGDNKPLDIPPNVHPPEGPAIPSELTHAVAQKVKAVMIDCVASLPQDARGEKPRLEGQIEISIKDHKVRIEKSTMQLRNVSGESVEPTRQCIESKSVGIENSAPDQSDLASYPINISFAIP
ncbi:MAG TPA: hypothetical protein VFV99_13525 [Kofleriaceae bacterium]|nr:hypothetical protein [Kofleriaceae bacterium]